MTLETAGIAVLWIVLALRLPGAVRHREQRALWAAVALLGLLTTLYVGAVQDGLADRAGKYYVYLGTHLVSVATAAVTLHFLLIADGRRRRAGWVYGSAGATIAVLIAVYAAASPEHPEPGNAPELPLAYFLLVSLFSVVALGICAAVCGISARRADHWSLRWGLPLLAAGWSLNALPWLLNIAWLLTEDDRWIAGFASIDGVSALCLAAGTALPVETAVRARIRDGRDHRSLGPLWRSLTADAPTVVLRRPLLPMRWRLERRLAEIRDAMLALRNHVTPEELADIRRHAESEAAAVAAWLHTAQRRKRAGHPPQPHVIDLSATGDDRASEIRFLRQVAEAHRNAAVLGDVS